MKSKTARDFETYAEHAASSRAKLAPLGLDCIHYATDWSRRSNALYERADGLNLVPERIGLLPDGRIVLVCTSCWIFETKES